MAKLHHGLSSKNVRKLALELADTNSSLLAAKPITRTILDDLSIKTAEATSLGRAMGFNKPIVDRFHYNLKEIYDKYKLGPDQIYNMDETALTTVQDTGKVIAIKGQKQVGHITSNERGTFVTMCGAMNALGNAIPPLVFNV